MRRILNWFMESNCGKYLFVGVALGYGLRMASIHILTGGLV